MSTSRLMPRVRGPRLRPMRVLNTGSVKMLNPSILSRTVLCPSHAACKPWFGQSSGCGRNAAGTISRA